MLPQFYWPCIVTYNDYTLPSTTPALGFYVETKVQECCAYADSQEHFHIQTLTVEKVLGPGDTEGGEEAEAVSLLLSGGGVHAQSRKQGPWCI